MTPAPSSQAALFEPAPVPMRGQVALHVPDPPTSADERLARMLAGAERARKRRTRNAYSTALYETRDMPCTCPLFGRSAETLRELGAGCTAPRWTCPRLAAVRRRLGV